MRDLFAQSYWSGAFPLLSQTIAKRLRKIDDDHGADFHLKIGRGGDAVITNIAHRPAVYQTKSDFRFVWIFTLRALCSKIS